METKDKEQVFLAKQQFQEVLRIIEEIRTIQNINIDYNNKNFGEDSRKIYLRTAGYKNQ